MRPIHKGQKDDFKPYQDAQIPLRDAIGRFCSYCEQAKELEVEHIVPRSKGGAEHEWENFLLSCKHCNLNKSNKNNSRNGYYWADIHNTAYAFVYLENNKVQPNPKLSIDEKQTARKTIDLLGLNRLPSSDNPPSRKDERFLERQQTWNIALEALENWKEVSTQQMTKQIVSTAHQHFSVWMTVFKDVSEVKLALMDKFQGTAKNCFDKNGNSKPFIQRK